MADAVERLRPVEVDGQCPLDLAVRSAGAGSASLCAKNFSRASVNGTERPTCEPSALSASALLRASCNVVVGYAPMGNAAIAYLRDERF